MTDILIRPAISSDLEVLWEFQAMAAYEPNATAAKSHPMVATYLDGWRRPDDFGFIAERHGSAIGATWARQFPPNENPAYYCVERTPELSIGVSPNTRGQGVGELLLRALIAEAARRDLGLCLNVRSTNPARRLYERLGFQAVPGMTVTNRVGGLSTWMTLNTIP